MLGFLMWIFSSRRAESAAARGEYERAREILEKFVERVPKSRSGWYSLQAMALRSGASPDERLALVRRAWAALPYDYWIVSDLVAYLLLAFMEKGDRKLLAEAKTVAAEFESTLGESPESWLMHAEIAQADGEIELARSLCRRAEIALEYQPPGVMTANLATCMVSIPGERERAVALLERAAPKTGNYRHRVFLSVLLEETDPDKSAEVRELARRQARRRGVSDDLFERVLEETRIDVQRSFEHMAKMTD